MAFEFLKDYKPEKITDGFEPFKGTYNCVVNYSRVEPYEGDKEDYKGHEFLRYELEVADGQANAGRRLFSPFLDLSSEEGQKKVADIFFTLFAEDIKSEEDFAKCNDKFAEATLQVKAWHYQPKDKDADRKQMHKILGLSEVKGEKKESDVPF